MVPTHRYLRNYSLKRGDTVVDVGAHHGRFVSEVLKTPASKVVAVEPSPYACRKLHEIKDNRLIVVEKAVWINNRASPYVCKVKSELNCLSSNIKYWLPENTVNNINGGAATVECVTLDGLARDLKLGDIDFLKVDAEGSELAVLLGANSVLPNVHHVGISIYGSDGHAQVQNHKGFVSALSFVLETYGFAVSSNMSEEQEAYWALYGDRIERYE